MHHCVHSPLLNLSIVLSVLSIAKWWMVVTLGHSAGGTKWELLMLNSCSGAPLDPEHVVDDPL